MPSPPSRAALITQMFDALDPGDRLTAPEVVEGLLHHDHDFLVNHEIGQLTLTRRTLTALVGRGVLIEADPVEDQPAWTLGPRMAPTPPSTSPSSTSVTCALGTAADPASQQPVPAGNVVAAAFCATLLILGFLILVIGTFQSR